METDGCLLCKLGLGQMIYKARLEADLCCTLASLLLRTLIEFHPSPALALLSLHQHRSNQTLCLVSRQRTTGAHYALHALVEIIFHRW